MTIQSTVRAALQTSLAAVAANVYDHVPEALIPPAIVIVPDNPYLEPTSLGGATKRIQCNFLVTLCVAYNSNPGSLDNLEQLAISTMNALPSGYTYGIGNLSKPRVETINTTTMLVADIQVFAIYQP